MRLHKQSSKKKEKTECCRPHEIRISRVCLSGTRRWETYLTPAEFRYSKIISKWQVTLLQGSERGIGNRTSRRPSTPCTIFPPTAKDSDQTIRRSVYIPYIPQQISPTYYPPIDLNQIARTLPSKPPPRPPRHIIPISTRPKGYLIGRRSIASLGSPTSLLSVTERIFSPSIPRGWSDRRPRARIIPDS